MCTKVYKKFFNEICCWPLVFQDLDYLKYHIVRVVTLLGKIWIGSEMLLNIRETLRNMKSFLPKIKNSNQAISNKKSYTKLLCQESKLYHLLKDRENLYIKCMLQFVCF